MLCYTLFLLLVMRKSYIDVNDALKDVIFMLVHYRLREIDIELMRRLSPRVNVIPVVGRADSLTPQELKDFKRRASDCKS